MLDQDGDGALKVRDRQGFRPLILNRVKLNRAKLAALRGVVFRCGIACLPLVAVILLCVMMFSGLSKPKATAADSFNVNNALFPRAEASEVEAGKEKVVQAAFERMHITHATIRVPN